MRGSSRLHSIVHVSAVLLFNSIGIYLFSFYSVWIFGVLAFPAKKNTVNRSIIKIMNINNKRGAMMRKGSVTMSQ